MNKFLPTTRRELDDRNWKQLDIIIVSGDAYVDHPSFGAAILGRYLESIGYKVGIIPQPDWKSDKDFLELGVPRLFFGVTAGNMDSLVNHYTASKKIRSSDAFSPDGVVGLRPNRATIIYTQKLKTLFKNIPIIIGGIEASLRRIPHYDYWSNKVRDSILLDSKADILVYGMAERPIKQISERLSSGENIAEISDIAGTVVRESGRVNYTNIQLPEFHRNYNEHEYFQMHKVFLQHRNSSILLQKSGSRILKHNPPSTKLSEEEIDAVYNIDFQKRPHPRYEGSRIAAYEQIRNSITSHRGCFGGCSFCAISLHQGKGVQSRSAGSIIGEIAKLGGNDKFRGTVSDIGGPTANMYGMFCRLGIDQECPRESCVYPDICSNLETNHQPLLNLLKKSREIAGVKNVFVASGLRFDLIKHEDEYLHEMCEHHIGGLLKLAPEHKSDKVLKLMNKPSFKIYENFVKKFRALNQRLGKRQFIVPYIIVGHPGSELSDTIELAVYLKKNRIKLEQVQQFTPTPMTLSTMMYFTKKDLAGNSINVPEGRELRLQKALVQWYKPENRKLIMEALKQADRTDLSGFFV
jgi:uncharacterized radical SAM protein YgiQ